MEQILYLLVGAGWLLFNLYKKSQEAKAERESEQRRPRGEEAFETQTQPEETTYVPKKSLEEMILEQFGERKLEPKLVTPQFVAVSPSPFLTSDAPKYAEGQRPRVRRRSTKVKVQERPTVFQSDLLGEELDVRKAFIYNTILQRPYA